MKNKISILLSIIFIAIGVFFFFISKFMMYEFSKPLENEEDAVATITDITEDDVYFTFEASNGETYTVKSNYQSSSMKIGDKLEIHYNAKNPNNAKVDIKEFSKVFKYVFYGVSALMTTIGIVILIISILSEVSKNKLLKSGLMLSATISSVDYNTYINVNGRHPYIIRANFIYNGLTYETKSESMWKDPQFIIDNYGIKELPVYINPDNPKSNILDISEIKNKLGK